MPGSRTPSGVDLDAIDADHGRHCYDLLVRLSDCWRVVAEAMRTAGECVPQAATGYDATWTSEVDWLLTTMDWWGEDAWCLEWVTTEVEAIRGKLLHSIDARVDRTACPRCGVHLGAHATDVLIVATCPACDYVAGMRPRTHIGRLVQERRLARIDAARRLLGVLDKGTPT